MKSSLKYTWTVLWAPDVEPPRGGGIHGYLPSKSSNLFTNFDLRLITLKGDVNFYGILQKEPHRFLRWLRADKIGIGPCRHQALHGTKLLPILDESKNVQKSWNEAANSLFVVEDPVPNSQRRQQSPGYSIYQGIRDAGKYLSRLSRD